MNKQSLYIKINNLILELVTNIPRPHPKIISSDDIPSLIQNASYKAAAVSGALSLPAGLLSALTILPDLVAVWKIQAQLVADIAQAHGKWDQLSRETLIYCLFGEDKFSSEDLVVRIGHRFVVRRSSQKIFEGLIGKIGLRIAKSLIGDRIARVIPFIGAAFVARYSFKDTEKVGLVAKDLFSSQIEFKQ
jgi:hypothetical protein